MYDLTNPIGCNLISIHVLINALHTLISVLDLTNSLGHNLISVIDLTNLLGRNLIPVLGLTNPLGHSPCSYKSSQVADNTFYSTLLAAFF